MAAFIQNNPGVQESEDVANGNRPIHIAVQNGHIDVVALLIKHKVNVNAKNKAGNTAVHMGRSYDYYWCCKLLVDAGASLTKKNNAGHESGSGLEGEKLSDTHIPALISAHNAEQLNLALELINQQEQVDKSQLVMAGMGKKRSAKALWTAEVDAKFKELCRKF